MSDVSVMKTLFPVMLLSFVSFLILSACGGADPERATAPKPTPSVAPTAVATATIPPAPTSTTEPTAVPQVSAGTAPAGFDRVVACLEERLGAKVAQALVSGDRRETTQEEAVLEECLLVTASGLAAEALPPSAAACLEDKLGTGVVQIVGSGARELTAQEDEVLLECLVSSALATPEEAPPSQLESCLQDRLGIDIARVVASRSVPLNKEETQALNNCALASALAGTEQTVETRVLACLEERLGSDIAAVVASRAVPLTDAEEAALGDCLVGASLEASQEASGATTGQAPDGAVIACLGERLGEDIAAVVASGVIPLTETEQEILGECLLSATLVTSSETASPAVTACLEEQLGADIAAVVASGAIPLTAAEAKIMGDCVLQEAFSGDR